MTIDSTKVERKHRRKRSSADSGRGSATNLNAPLEEKERVASPPNGQACKDPVGLESVVAKRERNGEVPVRTRRSVSKYAEVACLGSVLLAIAALFTIPVIFYHLEQVSHTYLERRPNFFAPRR